MSIAELSDLIRILQGPTGYTQNNLSPGPQRAPIVTQPGLVLIKPQFTSGTALEHEMVTWWSGSGAVGLTVAQLTQIQSTFDTYMQSAFASWGANVSKYNSSYVQDYSATNGLSVSPVVMSTAGGGGGQSPDNVAILVSWKTAERYKGGHGRWYLPAVGAGNINAPNTVNPSQAAAIHTAIAGLLTGMSGLSGTYGGPYNFVIYRNRTGVRGTPHVLVPTSFVIQPNLATQRRRLRKAAHH